jgi:streptomycin 3"-adenylyltransferase
MAACVCTVTAVYRSAFSMALCAHRDPLRPAQRMARRWEPKCPPVVRSQIRALLEGFGSICGGNLLGVYLHGSLAMGCFNPATSDIDILAVVKRPCGLQTKRLLAELFLITSSNPCPIECSVLRRKAHIPWRHPVRYAFHYGETWRSRLSRGSSLLAQGEGDPDLAAHVSVTRSRGRVLSGAPIAEVFPEVPVVDYLASAMDDFRWACRRRKLYRLEPGRPQMPGWVYLVLNALRTWSLLSTGQIQSKYEGASWAMPRLPPEHRELVRLAMRIYRGDRNTRGRASHRAVDRFVDFIEGRFQKSETLASKIQWVPKDSAPDSALYTADKRPDRRRVPESPVEAKIEKRLHPAKNVLNATVTRQPVKQRGGGSFSGKSLRQ